MQQILERVLKGRVKGLKGKIARIRAPPVVNLYLMLPILLRMIPQVRHILCPKFPIKVGRSGASGGFARAERYSRKFDPGPQEDFIAEIQA